MKSSQPQLLVDLGTKMSRVADHWAVVNHVLPPDFPLVLLAGIECEGFEALAGRLPELREGVLGAAWCLKLARAEYEGRKREVHGWLRRINQWMRGYVRWTGWWVLRQRVPGRGQGYPIWLDAAQNALSMWRGMEQNPPDIRIGWPMDLGPGRTLAAFAELVWAFERAHESVANAEFELRLARAGLARAQEEATALLMAYGLGVRARVGNNAATARSIPQLWPRHARRARAAHRLAA